ncbi:MAG: cache domain-containing protein [bacterium]|nr:MAG: cache domain-containing protein [bacterium]
MLKYTKNPFLISFAFLLFSILFLSIFFNKISRDKLVEQIQHRQQMSVRAGANSVESFLTSVGSMTTLLAIDPRIEAFDEFIKAWQDESISGVVAADKNGLVYLHSERGNVESEGQSVIERDYFEWARTAKKGEYKVFPAIVSKLGSSKGKYILPIASPVVKSDNFDGVVVVAVVLSDLVEHYINGLEILESSDYYLVTNRGEIIYSTIPSLIGYKLEDLLANKFLGSQIIYDLIREEMASEGDTVLNLAIPNSDRSHKLEPYLVNASTIKLADRNWKLVTTTPENDLKAFTFNFYSNQILVIFITVAIFIMLTLRASKQTGYDQAVEDEHQRHNLGKHSKS